MTISELEEKSGVARRTIHFYIKNKLLPPADKPGGGARYDEEHLLRLLMIRQMQKERFTLAEIGDRLDETIANMDTQQKSLRLQALQAHHTRKSQGTVEDLQRFLSRSHLFEDVCASEMREEDNSEHVWDDFSLETFSFADLSSLSSRDDHSREVLKDRAFSQKEFAQGLGQEAWIRIRVQEGIEIQIRDDVFRKNPDKVHAWVSMYRKVIGKEEK